MTTTMVLTPTMCVETEPVTTITTRMTGEINGRPTQTIVYHDCASGVGIKIAGGHTDSGDRKHHIFVKRILPGGLAALEGHLQEGDQILEVNGESLDFVSNEKAVSLLRQASADNYLRLVVTRDQLAREEFRQLMENGYCYSSASSVSDRNSISSRASTPSIHDGRPRPAQITKKSSPVNRQSSGSSTPTTDQLPYTEQRHTHQAAEELSSASDPDNLTSTASPSDQSPPVNSDLQAAPGAASPAPPPKIPNSAASLLHQQHRGLLLAPSMASTPQSTTAGLKPNSTQPPADASLPQQSLFEPSPVLGGASGHLQPSSLMGQEYGSPGTSYEHLGLVNMAPPPPPSQANKLSLDPDVRLRVEKLQVALKYLGLDPTPEQQMEMRGKLNVDPTGVVTYGEFVRVAREIFKFQLEERNMSGSSQFFPAGDLKDFLDPPAFRSQVDTLPEMPVQDELERVRQDRDSLQREVERLKLLLREKERSCNRAEEELLRVRREAQGAIHESRSLRSKVHLAEQAQRAARNMEQDYEEVVRLLETEITDLKAQQTRSLESPAVQKRLAVLGCQLRKAEVGKKTYEVATEKLLQFAEMVHQNMSSQPEAQAPRVDPIPGEAGQGGRPPGYLTKHRKSSSGSLATEAREVVKAVRSLIEAEPLPFGWEEAYTSDGMKYYINHVTQMTTWVHPVSNIQQGTSSSHAGHLPVPSTESRT